MSLIYRDRFKEAIWFKPDVEVTIGGLGSIGSWLALFMGRIVNQIYTYEMDSIEEHNLSGQLYGKNDVGKTKFTSLSSRLADLSPSVILTNNGEYKENLPVTDIVFACFDSINARKMMFETWKSKETKELFIDGRLTAEDFWVYVVTPEREEEYEKYLFSDDEVDDLPCSFKSTSHISSMLASYMTNMYTNYIANKEIGDEVYALPFETIYNAPLSLLNRKELVLQDV